ncbi:LPS translocon maturation chaperone LptM [Methylophaga sp.]
MQKFLRWNLSAILLCGILMLTACGQTGDLYLPQGGTDNSSAG